MEALCNLGTACRSDGKLGWTSADGILLGDNTFLGSQIQYRALINIDKQRLDSLEFFTGLKEAKCDKKEVYKLCLQ